MGTALNKFDLIGCVFYWAGTAPGGTAWGTAFPNIRTVWSEVSKGTRGMRNLREMRTPTTVLDLLASNQVLQAMDIISQRIKSVELFVSQGHWAQGSLLELVAAEGEQRAYSREEVKVAQVEYKAELQMQKAQWQRPTQWWMKDNRTPVNPPGDKGEDGEKGDRAPTNTGGQEKGKKGKGKGKKGKRKW